MPGGGIPDWRNADAYGPIRSADNALLCWEWLRRDPDYRRAAKSRGSPVDWGLIAFEDPNLAIPDARPMWTAQSGASVLEARGGPIAAAADTFDIKAPDITAAVDGDGLHLCISDGLHTIRIDLDRLSPAVRLVQLRYRLAGFASLDRPLAALLRLRNYVRSGKMENEPVSPQLRARQILVLRTRDALDAGVDQRTIAGTLLQHSAYDPAWRLNQSSLRSRVQRLVRSARSMTNGRLWTLLAPSVRRETSAQGFERDGSGKS